MTRKDCNSETIKTRNNMVKIKIFLNMKSVKLHEMENT